MDLDYPSRLNGARAMAPWRPASGRARSGRVLAQALRHVLLRALAALALAALSVQAWNADRIVQAAQRYGANAVRNAKALQQVMEGVVGKDDVSELTAVNDFYNRHIAYKEDIDNWGQLDYWASPLESLQKGAGDCEDYAIAKYFTLVALGMPHERLRMVYVRATVAGAPNGYLPHMVLAYYRQADAEPLVLDILQSDIRPAGARPDLAPVFSFNADGLWQGVGSVRAKGDPQVRLSRWREVLVKAREEGFE